MQQEAPREPFSPWEATRPAAMAGLFPPPFMTNELPEEQAKQVHTLLVALREKLQTSDNKFTEEDVIATAKTYKLIQEIYHSNARLAGEEGLLVDTGAVLNLTGDSWTRRMDQRLPEGMSPEYKT